MDLASLIGFGLCTFFLIFGILSGGGQFKWFIDIRSLIITVGGALAATMAAYKMDEFINGLKGLTLALKEPSKQNAAESISTIIGLSNTARKEGLLALDEATQGIEDPFLHRGYRGYQNDSSGYAGRSKSKRTSHILGRGSG